MNEITKREDALFENISKLIDEARKHVKTTVNTAMAYTYFGVGKYIIEDEQSPASHSGRNNLHTSASVRGLDASTCLFSSL